MISRFLVNISTLIVTLSMSISGASKATYTKYTAVPGYFLQGDPGTDPITFQYVRNVLIAQYSTEINNTLAEDLHLHRNRIPAIWA